MLTAIALFATLTAGPYAAGFESLFVRDLSKKEPTFKPLIPEIGDSSFGVLDNVGDKLLVETNHKAPNSRVVLIDPAEYHR